MSAASLLAHSPLDKLESRGLPRQGDSMWILDDWSERFIQLLKASPVVAVSAVSLCYLLLLVDVDEFDRLWVTVYCIVGADYG